MKSSCQVLHRIAPLAIAFACSTISLATADEFWLTDRANNRVIAMDAENGKYLRTIADTMLAQPTSLTEATDGFIYVTNGSLGPEEAPVPRVVKINPTTGVTTAFDVGNASTEEAPLLGGGILFADNSLYVSEFGQFDGNRVFRFNLSGGDPVQTIGAASSNTGRTGLTLQNGELYVSAFGDFTLPGPLAGLPVGAVLKHDGAGGLTTFANGVGLSQTVLLGANGLDFKGDGSALYVASLVGQGLVKYTITGGVAGSPEAYGQSIAYPSGMLVTDQANRESLIATGLGNDNPQDPIYMGFLFPGGIVRYDLATGNKVSFLVGDFNGDLTVNDADLTAWSGAFGATSAGDSQGEGNSYGDDFLAWQHNQGNQGVLDSNFQPTAIIRHVTAGFGTSVPEPATVGAALLSTLVAVTWRRRRTHA